MTLLPIVARELRVASRRAATYWTRFTFALLAIIVGSFAWAMLLHQSPRETGYRLFIWLAVLAYLYSLISGALATADCVSEEKREGTLGLLFLTDLRSYDIVLGKLAASSITAIYGLLALFPILGIPLLLGGVAPAEFWRVVLVCLNNLFFSLTLGLICSTLCKDERKSIGLAILIILLITAAWPGLVAWIAVSIQSSHPLYNLLRNHPEGLLVPTPGFACFFAFDDAYKSMTRGATFNWFYLSLGVVNAMGWVSLILTTIILPRIWHDKAATAATLRRREKVRVWTAGTSDVRDAFRRHLLEINPFYWLASRDRFKGTLVWLWVGAAALVWALGLANARRDWLEVGVYVMTALLAHSFFKCWVAMEASKQLGADRRSGALELLLSTPLSVPDILRGQWLALLRQFGPAVALVCAVDLVFLGLGLKETGSNDRGSWILTCLAGIGVFVLDLITLALLSMWLSLRGRKTSQAGLSAIVRVCVVPWFLFGAFCAFVAVLDEVFGYSALPSDYREGQWLLTVWVGISAVNDFLLGASALRNLRTRFRSVAMERVETRAGIWQRLLARKRVE